MPRLERLRRMTGPEYRLLVEAAVLLPLVGASVRVAGLRRTIRRLDRPTPGQGDAAGRAALVQSTGETVALAAAHLPLYRPTCLTRSLVLRYLLQRRGVAADLRLGVATLGGRFAAHAWVEHDGQVINDSPDVARRFAPLDVPQEFPRTWV